MTTPFWCLCLIIGSFYKAVYRPMFGNVRSFFSPNPMNLDANLGFLSPATLYVHGPIVGFPLLLAVHFRLTSVVGPLFRTIYRARVLTVIGRWVANLFILVLRLFVTNRGRFPTTFVVLAREGQRKTLRPFTCVFGHPYRLPSRVVFVRSSYDI